MTPEQVASLDFAAINHFWQSDLGRHFSSKADCVRRELAFTARFSAAEVNALMGQPEFASREEFVVVQGVADLAVLLPGEIWLLDFKTDVITVDEVPAKRQFYEPQLRLYALALRKIYGRPVTQRWLHFLALRKSEPLAT